MDLLYFVLTKHRVWDLVTASVVYLFNSPIVIIVSAHNLGDFLDIEANKVQDPKSVNKDQDSNTTRSCQNAQGSVSERKHFEISSGL